MFEVRAKEIVRVLRSEVIPLELPPRFDISIICDFVQKVDLVIYTDFKNIEYVWVEDSHLSTILFLYMLGVKHNDPSHFSINNGVCKVKRDKLLKGQDWWFKPLSFQYENSNDNFRELSIVHPHIQLIIAAFYSKYYVNILSLCEISDFSLRKPIRKRKQKYYKSGQKSKFFDYAPIRYLPAFYESDSFLNSEKQFSKLYHSDIANCFGSIYTHSIVWAVFGKDVTKDRFAYIDDSFPSVFDRIMQCSNVGETNGIVAGGEFPRLFSEIIFQSIDKELENQLGLKSIRNNCDYKILRYLDDFLIFYNNQNDFDEIKIELKKILFRYKMHLNVNKSKQFHVPFISSESAAQFEIDLYFGNLDTCNSFRKSNFIKLYKSVINKYEVIPSKINYHVFNLLDQFFFNPKTDCFKGSIDVAVNVIEVAFYIISLHSQPSHLCRLIGIITKVYTSFSADVTAQKNIASLIINLTIGELYKLNVSPVRKVDIYYFIEILIWITQPFGKYLTEKCLIDLFKLDRYQFDMSTYEKAELCVYFDVISILSYIKYDNQYNILREIVYDIAICKVEVNFSKIATESETLFLFLDILGSPYINYKDSQRLISLLPNSLNGVSLYDLKYKGIKFTNWDKLNISSLFKNINYRHIYLD